MPSGIRRLLGRVREALGGAIRWVRRIIAPRRLYRFRVTLSRDGCIDNRFFIAEVECTAKRDPSEAADRAAAAALKAAGVRSLEVKVEAEELVGTVGEDTCRVVKIGELYDVWDYSFYFSYRNRERPSQNREFEVRVTFWLNHGDDPERWWDAAEKIALLYIEMFGIKDLTGWAIERARGAEFKKHDTTKKDFDVEINDLYRASQGPWSRSYIEKTARILAAARELGLWGEEGG